MTNGQAGQGGGRLYSEDDVEILLNETAKRAANEAIRSVRPTRQQQREEREERDTDEELGMSSKLVKQLQTTVSVFNTLKEFSSNPLQKAIESKVGDLAAGVIEQAFTRPSGPPPKRDLVETFLNSQLGFGLGQGLGQRAPEFVESISRMFGKDKAEQMIDGVIGKYGKGGGSSGGSGTGGYSDQGRGLPPPSSSPDVGPETGKQSEKEILLSLDPNNPEHVSAYAETQGGISVDVARKMLMIHQDEFIKQMKTQGANVEELSKIRGSHIDKPQSSSSQRVDTPQDAYVPPSDYADFREVPQPSPLHQSAREPIQDFDANPGEDINHSSGNEKGDENQLNPQLLQFTEDIGKIMGDMVGKIETMNNTIFVLQNELNEIKGGKIPPTGQTPIGQPIAPPITQPPTALNTPTIINKPIDRMILGDIPNANISIDNNNIPNNIIPIDSENIPEASFDRPLGEPMDNMPEPLGIDDTNEFMKPPKPSAFSKISAGFFEENVQDINDFERELQEEASAAAKKFEEAMQQQKKSSEQPIQPALVKSPQPVPPLSHQLSPALSPPLMDIDNTNTINVDNTNVDKTTIENMINMENLNIDDPIQPPSLQTIPSPPTPVGPVGVPVGAPIGVPVGVPLKKQSDEKDEKDENTSNNDKSREKKYVRPINRKKNIFTPSFKSDKERDK